MKTAYRIEADALGRVVISGDVYWGIHTARSLESFAVSGRVVHPRLIDAVVRIKRAAATVNERAGKLDRRRAEAVRRACDEVLSGRLRDQFVVDKYQAGAGTSTNMNVNEVLANRGLEILRQVKGHYTALHPNDHVNLSQSTNDVYPAAIHLAALDALDDLFPEAMKLAASFFRLGRRYARVIKAGRTHLADAVPVTLGGEFRAYGSALRASIRGMKRAADGLRELGLGGTGVGTGLNAPRGFGPAACRELSKLTGKRLRSSRDLQMSMQSRRAAGDAAAALRGFALELGRIANDLRLLASGPETGLAEITLPAVQAGSSFMPGKVNPSILEMVNMVAFRVVGNDQAAAWAVAAGQLELNAMLPVLAESLLESIELLAAACERMRTRCVDGIAVDVTRCREYARRSPAVVTALAPKLGYAAAAALVRRASAAGRDVFAQARAEKLLDEKALRDAERRLFDIRKN